MTIENLLDVNIEIPPKDCFTEPLEMWAKVGTTVWRRDSTAMRGFFGKIVYSSKQLIVVEDPEGNAHTQFEGCQGANVMFFTRTTWENE